MKTFIKNLLKFLLTLTVIILAIHFTTGSIINRKANFKVASHPKYIVVGHSHPECALNDSLITNFKNLSDSGESYLYTYFKLKKIIEKNKSIKTVFLAFTNNEINSTIDDWTWDSMNISERYTKLSPFMDVQSNCILLKNNPSGFLNSFSYSNKDKIGQILHSEYDYSRRIGGYLYLVRDKIDSLIAALPKDKIIKRSNPKVSKINLKYLAKIIENCHQQGIKLFLIRCPIHPKCPGLFNEKEYKAIYKARFSSVELLDFKDFPLQNTDFGDLEHLNYKGAKKFSIWFEKLMTDGLLEKADKQKYINEKIIEESKVPISPLG